MLSTETIKDSILFEENHDARTRTYVMSAFSDLALPLQTQDKSEKYKFFTIACSTSLPDDLVKELYNDERERLRQHIITKWQTIWDQGYYETTTTTIKYYDSNGKEVDPWGDVCDNLLYSRSEIITTVTRECLDTSKGLLVVGTDKSICE